MKSTLIDAGPLIALFDKDDRFHQPVKEFLKTYTGRLITTWPVITETMHMLDFNVNVQIDFLKWYPGYYDDRFRFLHLSNKGQTCSH